MSLKNTLTFAKVVVDSHGQNALGTTSDLYHDAVTDLARAHKREGESIAKAYVRLAETTEAGALLFQAAKAAPKPPTQAAQDFSDTYQPIGDAAREMDRVVEEFRDKYNRTTTGRKLTRAQAYARVIDSNPGLRDRVRREEMEATVRVRDQRAPIRTSQEELETDFRLGSSRGSARN